MVILSPGASSYARGVDGAGWERAAPLEKASAVTTMRAAPTIDRRSRKPRPIRFRGRGCSARRPAPRATRTIGRAPDEQTHDHMSTSPSGTQHSGEGPEHDVEVEPQRPVADVECV